MSNILSPGLMPDSLKGMQTAFDAGSAGEKSTFQAAVSGPEVVLAGLAADPGTTAAAMLSVRAASPAFAHIAELSGPVQTVAAATYTQVNTPWISFLHGVEYVPGGSLQIAQKGVYALYASIRISDSAPAGTQYGIAVHTLVDDGPWMYWEAKGSAPSTRHTASYYRVAAYNVGDIIRLVTYSDSGCDISSVRVGVALIAPLV